LPAPGEGGIGSNPILPRRGQAHRLQHMHSWPRGASRGEAPALRRGTAEAKLGAVSLLHASLTGKGGRVRSSIVLTVPPTERRSFAFVLLPSACPRLLALACLPPSSYPLRLAPFVLLPSSCPRLLASFILSPPACPQAALPICWSRWGKQRRSIHG